MNKQDKLQLIDLLKVTRDHLDVDETPTYDEVDFTPIASDRFAHTDAILALAEDVATACQESMPEQTEPIAN